ncbi:phosphoribosylglycinamide formyltransferase [Aureimonas fodinaquatilis]|uniref:Phosphoribosylglycinamide formyltransferase n=1 Tax=Aureimonas fodinaquatilis TaxID=2565783 RepID=A0A5B0DWN1_9HYPH|nr:phosphoribosylglycinamide formyltransferase [Aureimonas fodinaquatilis]KAA0970231.1 phosphoribosylglycinamide formyltransferase [Aureimonas fodinaquatilis]
MSSPAPKKRVAILISGRGSNMSALLEAARADDFPGEICLVLSNRPDAKGLETAAAAGIATLAVDHKLYANRGDHEAAIAEALDAARPDIICLAGYMRILGAGFVARYKGRMINIHPSLLPLFPGLHTHERALQAGMRVHGCTVHYVTEVMDGGPIIAQAAISVLADDTPDSLAQRLLHAEHQLYPHALALALNGQVSMADDKVVLHGTSRCETILISPAV